MTQRFQRPDIFAAPVNVITLRRRPCLPDMDLPDDETYVEVPVVIPPARPSPPRTALRLSTGRTRPHSLRARLAWTWMCAADRRARRAAGEGTTWMTTMWRRANVWRRNRAVIAAGFGLFAALDGLGLAVLLPRIAGA